MCCEKCEEKVKEEIEELDGKLIQVTHVFKFALKFKMTQDPGMT